MNTLFPDLWTSVPLKDEIKKKKIQHSAKSKDGTLIEAFLYGDGVRRSESWQG